MIKNQVSINITRYGDQVPKGYPLDTQIVHIYSDSSNLFAALSKAYAKQSMPWKSGKGLRQELIYRQMQKNCIMVCFMAECMKKTLNSNITMIY